MTADLGTSELAADSAPKDKDKSGPGLRWPSRRTWADIAVMLVLAVLGIVGFEPSFGGYGFLAAGIGGLVLGAATGILSSMFRLGAITTALAAIVTYFIVGPALAVPEQAVFGVLPSLQSLASVAVGTVYGWADIVTLEHADRRARSTSRSCRTSRPGSSRCSRPRSPRAGCRAVRAPRGGSASRSSRRSRCTSPAS